jgi:transposase InsO family protein
MSDATAKNTIRILMMHWIYVYGVPKRILTDRGTNFVSKLFQEMAEFLGTKLNNTTAYRPQSNGQNERSHQELHAYLSIYLSQTTSKNWPMMLRLAAWIHNSSVHESMGMSPF